MRILFCFRDSCLCHMICCQEFAKGIGDLSLHKCHGFVRNRNIIFCETYIRCLNSLSAVESGKFIIAECSGDLSCTVRTEVKENHRIAVLDCCGRCAIFQNNRRHNELICLILIIGLLNGLHRILCRKSFSFNQCIIGFLYTVPSVIAVHRIVTSHHRSDFTDTDLSHFIHQFLYVVFS